MLDLFATLQEQSERSPRSIALASPDGFFTRQAFARNVNAFAAYALEQGVRPGQTVLVRTLRTDLRLQMMLGLMALGCRVVVTQLIDAFQANGVPLDVLMTDDLKSIAPVNARDGARPAPPAARIMPLDDGWLRMQPPAPLAPSSAYSLIFSSSGTTGTPKLMEVEGPAFAKRLALKLANENDGLRSRYLISAGAATSHVLQETITTILRGDTVLRPADPSSAAILEAIKIYQPTATVASPATVLDLVNMLQAEAAPIRKMQRLGITGAYAPPELQRRAAALLAETVATTYGATETGVIARSIFAEGQPAGYVGKVQAGVEVMTADEHGGALPTGAEGQLRVRVSREIPRYLGTAATAEAAPDDWFATGDIGRVDGDGNLYVLGRSSEVINVGGNKVNPEMVEATAVQHAAIGDCAVAGVAGADGMVRLHAAIVSRRPVNLVSLNEYLVRANRRFELAGIRRVDAIPRTTTGKVDRPALRKLLEA